MIITFSYQEVREILQDHFDDSGMEVLIDQVFGDVDESGHLITLDLYVSRKSEILKEASK